MKPVVVSTTVPNRVEEVFDFLDLMANHEAFTDHFLRDWSYAGADRGVDARATAEAVAAGRSDSVEIELVAAAPPTIIVERTTWAGGRRVAEGTYILTELPDGWTRITFEYAWQRAPLHERVVAPLVR